ncbi:MAG: hypothetical protein ACE1ZD_00560, partial [Dehalococcoidia bacterium]
GAAIALAWWWGDIHWVGLLTALVGMTAGGGLIWSVRIIGSDYVVIKGTATLNDQDIWDEARRIMARYVPEDEIEQHLEMWKTQPRVLVTVTPTRISSRRR